MTPLRLTAFLEATTVTGPAKNLLQFASLAKQQQGEKIPVETTIAVFQRPGDSRVFEDAARKAGVAVEFIPEQGRFDRSVLSRMTALVDRLKPNVIQTHAVKSHFLVCRAGLPDKTPWVAFHHGYTWTDLRVRLYNQLDRWSLKKAQHVITVSLPFEGELKKMGVAESRITVVHNAIDPGWGRRTADSAALRAQLGIGPERRVLLLVGRFSLEKDHIGLLDAVAQLHREGVREAHILLVGDGPERPRIEAHAAKLGLSGHLTLTGQVPSAEPYYSVADIAVLNSRTEGSPNALLEAMAAKVPVVATAVGGIPEIVTSRESALLVPAGDSGRLASALAEVLRNSVLAGDLVSAAEARIEQYHSPAARVRRLSEVYRAVGKANG